MDIVAILRASPDRKGIECRLCKTCVQACCSSAAKPKLQIIRRPSQVHITLPLALSSPFLTCLSARLPSRYLQELSSPESPFPRSLVRCPPHCHPSTLPKGRSSLLVSRLERLYQR